MAFTHHSIGDSAPKRSQNDFRSVDSAPPDFSRPVALWRAPVLLALFIVTSSVLLYLIENNPWFQNHFHGRDLLTAPVSGGHSVPLRIFVVSFMFSFGLFTSGNLRSRLRLTLDLLITYCFICAVIDFTSFIYSETFEDPISITAVEILSGLIGYLVFAFKLLENGSMPSRIPVEIGENKDNRAMLRLILVIFLAAVGTVTFNSMFIGVIDFARQIAVLGGIGPGVFLFLPLIFILLYVAARLDSVSRTEEAFSPPISIIIPAHNEEYIIEQTIRCIDIAAGNYPGPVTVLVMDNNSTDKTSLLAADALMACTSATGRVIAEPKPGKSHALNAALDATETDFVIRIDADTQIRPRSLFFTMRIMKDPSVGVVGGLALPPEGGGGPFDRARLLELIVKHGFYSVGLSAVNSVVGVPGMFAAYRTELPRRLGGFVQGMNGEDTDMSLRIGVLGYRLIVDPRIKYYSEVPATYMHMREQRLRWFRSVFHVSSRCRDLLYSLHMSVRGKVMLPFMLANSALRAMMVPMLIFGTLLATLPGIGERDIPWTAILAVVFGMPAIMAVVCALLNKYALAILYVPEYLIFRFLRAYFMLESNLSIRIKEEHQHLYSSKGRARPQDKAAREA